jgi:hypothetical protein
VVRPALASDWESADAERLPSTVRFAVTDDATNEEAASEENVAGEDVALISTQ